MYETVVGRTRSYRGSDHTHCKFHDRNVVPATITTKKSAESKKTVSAKRILVHFTDIIQAFDSVFSPVIPGMRNKGRKKSYRNVMKQDPFANARLTLCMNVFAELTRVTKRALEVALCEQSLTISIRWTIISLFIRKHWI